MSLSLSSTIVSLDKELQSVNADGVTSNVEFQRIRDVADQNVASFIKGAPSDNGVQGALEDFQKAADAAVEALQKVALAARKNKLSDDQRNVLKSGVEHQTAYFVIGYKSSVEKL